MAISLTHTTTSAEPDSGDGKISSNAWNEAHTLTMATARILGRTTAGTGAVEELTAAGVKAFLDLEAGTDFIGIGGGTYTGDVSVPDEAFGSGWDGSVEVPTKNAVYDRIQNTWPVPVSTHWFHVENGHYFSNSSAVVADTIYYSPVFVPRTVTISDLGTDHRGTVGVGNMKIAIYANNASTNRPTGTPVAETGNISTNTGGFISGDITGANVTLTGGTLYWMAIWSSISGPAFCAMNQGGAAWIGASAGGSLSQGGDAVGYVLTSSEAFGTWPDAASETISLVQRGSFIGRFVLIAKAA